jgi:hypothetical protein
VSKREVRVASGEEIVLADPEAVAELAQRLCEVRRNAAAIGSQDPLELDEAPEAVDPIEVDPHSFDDEEATCFRNHDKDAESSRERLPQPTGILDRNDPITAFPLFAGVGPLVGDQVRPCSLLFAKLEAAAGDVEVGVLLDQNALVLGADLFADPLRARGIAVPGLQLQISAGQDQPATVGR